MKNIKKTVTKYEGITFEAYVPEEYSGTVIYTCMEEKTVMEVLGEMDVLPAVISFGCDWNRDLSPWKAEKVFKSEPDFEGGADAFLERLEKAVPEVEKELKIVDPERAIAGYSMAGLFAVYAVYRTKMFRKMASISGSLWFDSFAEYATNGLTKPFVDKAYFSLGDREADTKNVRMSTVKIMTEIIYNYFNSSVCDTVYTLNPGGHFSEISHRISDAFRWIIQ